MCPIRTHKSGGFDYILLKCDEKFHLTCCDQVMPEKLDGNLYNLLVNNRNVRFDISSFHEATMASAEWPF